MSRWNILYRGSLSSCNYACGYCPFAKTNNTREELDRDHAELTSFVDWVRQLRRPIGVFFTPWGEAIIHRYYRQAMVQLTHLPHVRRVAIQTNLSCGLSDLSDARTESLGLWATYHPGEVSIQDFLGRCKELDGMQIRYSVGVVGLREHFDEIIRLRNELRSGVYLWVNAYKRVKDYYSDDELLRLREVDPYFDLNRHYYPSQGEECGAGETSFTVDGAGDVRRCHFIGDRLGNIFVDDISQLLRPRLCTNTTCGCHIGYVHRNDLNLHELYGENVLERVPADWPNVAAEFVRDGSTN